MDRERIVDFRGDPGGVQKGFQIVPPSASDGELVIYMFESRRRLGWSRQKSGYSGLGEKVPVALRAILPSLLPIIQVPQLHAQHRGLQRMQAAVCPDNLVKISFLAAMHAQHLQALGSARIVCGNQPPVARPSQILRWEKAEAPILPECAGISARVARPNRLRRIFDHRQLAGLRNLQNRIEISWQAK